MNISENWQFLAYSMYLVGHSHESYFVNDIINVDIDVIDNYGRNINVEYLKLFKSEFDMPSHTLSPIQMRK